MEAKMGEEVKPGWIQIKYTSRCGCLTSFRLTPLSNTLFIKPIAVSWDIWFKLYFVLKTGKNRHYVSHPLKPKHCQEIIVWQIKYIHSMVLVTVQSYAKKPVLATKISDLLYLLSTLSYVRQFYLSKKISKSKNINGNYLSLFFNRYP